MSGVFDDALEKRYAEQPEIAIANIDGVDVLLIRNAADGLIYRLPASTLASFVNAAISQADLLDALNAPNGVATLDSGGKVPAAQLPAYVDDVLEYASTAAFPATGEAGKIYVALDTNKTYRWSGSGYVEISASLALGETSSTAYRGDRGKTAYDHSQSTGNPHGTSKADLGLGNVDNTSDANKPLSTAQQTALNGKASISSGTWTPVVGSIAAGPSPGASAAYSGTYTKLGNLVFVDFVLNFNDAANPVELNDRFSLSGLPFDPSGAAITGAGKAWQYVVFGAGNNAFWDVGCGPSSYLYLSCGQVSGTVNFSYSIRGSAVYRTAS